MLHQRYPDAAQRIVFAIFLDIGGVFGHPVTSVVIHLSRIGREGGI